MQTEGCRYCKDRQGNRLAMVMFTLPRQRLDRFLEKIGYWECELCGFAKPIFRKVTPLEQKPEQLQPTQCLCCYDTGQIHHYFVQQYIMSDYHNSDPPVPCKRCTVFKNQNKTQISQCWDIATPRDCDDIHTRQLDRQRKERGAC